MKISEIAQTLGVQAQTIRRYIADGRLPATKKGRQWIVDQADADKFIEDYKSGKHQKVVTGFARSDHPWRGKGRPSDPDSPTRSGNFSHIYLPSSPDEVQELRILSAEERLEILRKFAELKNAGVDIQTLLDSI